MFSIIIRNRLNIFKIKRPNINRIIIRSAVNLSYKIFGDSEVNGTPPIFLLHGLLENKRHWDIIGKTILNVMKRTVVAVDLRNHGDSPHVNSHKYEEVASDIMQLFEKLSIETASLIGHNMGGKAAMCVALLAPEKVAGLLIIDISPVSTTKLIRDHFPQILTSMKEFDFKNQKKLSVSKHEAKKKLKPIVTDEFILKAALCNIKKKSDGKIGWACNVDVLLKQIPTIASFPTTLQSKKYFGPALFIGGQLSEYLPADDLIEIREMFPTAVITYVPQTGHYLHIEDPKTFLSVAITFLKSNK